MLDVLAKAYYRATLDYPWVIWALILLLLIGAATQVRHFRLDASAESLVLEDDEDMRYYRGIRARYGSDDFLVVTYTPEKELFEGATLQRLKALRDELAGLETVESVTSILDVPLLDSPQVTFDELQEQESMRTLLDPDTDRDLARREFLTSPLYKDLLLNDDADTTTLLVILKRDPEAFTILRQRDELRLRAAGESLDEESARELARLEAAYADRNAELQERLQDTIAAVRSVLDAHRDAARIHLGGVPMIAADMIEFVRGDIRAFGIGVALFILVLLTVAFQRLRWVIVPAAICGGVALGMTGFLGLMKWPVTVVSSNFISLVLILTLSLIVHLVVRQRELHAANAGANAAALMRDTIDSKFKPSLYTAVTTIVAFGSMMLADIRPVMDFGLMMVCAVAFGFVLTFLLFPALVVLLPTGAPPVPRRDLTWRINHALAELVAKRPFAIWLVFGTILALSLIGTLRVTVENRFIDYFKSSTEIYQGMELIDRELGGTTPLDIVLDPPPEAAGAEDEIEDEEFDYFAARQDEGPSTGYWFTPTRLEIADAVHGYLESLPETGKVLSVATTMKLMTQLNGGEPLGPVELGVLYKRIPGELREILFDPYMIADGNQIRYSIRVIDSAPNLERDALLKKIRAGLIEKFQLQPEQAHLTGMLVLYNNVMQSLLSSQYVTMFVVFAAMMLMFGFLFRSPKMAVIGPLPTLIAALAILGLLGLTGIPLDMMTMTIAAITIGIGVHDTIHYTDRFQQEISRGADYQTATRVSHAQVGRAMVYTTVIITAGFSILVMSNFMPTIYFGVLTGVAMIFALLSNMTLLPLLLQRFRPFQPRS